MSVSASSAPPDPAGISTAAEFIQRLNDLRLWAGQPSLRRLQWLGGRLMTPNGDEVDALPPSTTSYVLRGRGLPRLPRMVFVEAYVSACFEVGGCTADDARRLVARWRSAWRKVAEGRSDREGETPTALRGDGSAAPGLVTPAQLPADLATFTDRADELNHLLTLGADASRATALVIAAVDGMAGIGKTALAVHAAHRLADWFPDGQLFVELHGFTERGPAVEPADALDQLLRALGVPGEQIPAGLGARATLYRTRMLDRRMLVLLDDAVAESQVRPLLPGSAGCFVLITSRKRLVGLDDARRLSLDVLPVDDSLTLFTRVAGMNGPKDLVEEIVELCGRLPLAIRIAATRLRTRPSWTVAYLAERLADRPQCLIELEAGECSVTSALDLSYDHLEPDEQCLYRRLGLAPGNDADVYAAAALADGTLEQTDLFLGRLYNAHLLQEPTPGRYRFHDLTRAHAAHTALREEPESARRAALTRLLELYCQCVSTAVDTLYPYEADQRPSAPHISTTVPTLTLLPDAAAWLDTELKNLLAVASYAANHGWPAHTMHLSATLHRHLHRRGHYARAHTLHAQALCAARGIDDRTGEVDALTGLGDADSALGQYKAAVDCYQQALQIARGIRHRAGVVHALNGLGDLRRAQGKLRQALDHFLGALSTARDIAHHAGEVDALTGLGHVYRAQGRYGAAFEHILLALSVAREIRHRAGEVHALNALGHLLFTLGMPNRAATDFEQALAIARDIGLRSGELCALTGLGIVHHKQGKRRQAAGEFQQVLDQARADGSRSFQCGALRGLADTDRAVGHAADAIARHQAALDLALDLGQLEDQARAHCGLAWAHSDLGQHEQARTHWQYALTILTELNIPQIEDVTRDEVRRRLTTSG